jgi:hypothetical protein
MCTIMDHYSRVGEWKLEFAAAGSLVLSHSHRPQSIISTLPWGQLVRLCHTTQTADPGRI